MRKIQTGAHHRSLQAVIASDRPKAAEHRARSSAEPAPRALPNARALDFGDVLAAARQGGAERHGTPRVNAPFAEAWAGRDPTPVPFTASPAFLAGPKTVKGR